MSSKSRGWLVKNAVMAWLHNYAEKEAGDLTKDYQALYNILDAEYQPLQDDLDAQLKDEQPTTTKTQKRGRPAKRQRTKKASSDPPSTKENKKIPLENQEEVDEYMKKRDQ